MSRPAIHSQGPECRRFKFAEHFIAPSGSRAPVTDWSNFFPLSLNVFSPNYTTPEAMNYNLTAQHEFVGNAVFSIGYVGALGRHLIRTIEGNPITLAGQQACLSNTGAEAGCPANGFQQHLAYPQNSVYPGNIFGSVGSPSTDGNSTYNALQMSLNKGFGHGLGLLASRTRSHAIDDGSGFEDSGFQIRAMNPYPQFAYLNKGDSSYDARKRLVAGYTYRAPSFPGDHRLWNALVGGWQLSGITTFQSGFPVDISDSGYSSLTCDEFEYYDCSESPRQIAPLQTGDPRTDVYTNTSGKVVAHVLFNGPVTFSPATLGTFGGVARNSFHGSGLNTWDLALEKHIYFRPSYEDQYLQLRLEAYNVFNHTQFCNTAGPFPCVNANVESSTFGQVTTVNPSRLVQLGAKFYF